MSRPLPRYLDDTDPMKLDRIISMTANGEATTTITRGTLPGDTRRLRGIPVVGVTSGTIPGTDPEGALERRQQTTNRFDYRRLHRA